MVENANCPAAREQPIGQHDVNALCNSDSKYITDSSQMQPALFILTQRDNGTFRVDDPTALADWLRVAGYADQRPVGAEHLRLRNDRSGLVIIYATGVVIIQGTSAGAADAQTLLTARVQQQDVQAIQRWRHLAVKEYWTR